jgi:hypothetical protein
VNLTAKRRPEDWPFRVPQQTSPARYRGSGAAYIWLWQRHDELVKQQAEPGFSWREVAYRCGRDICAPSVFVPPSPKQIAASWAKLQRHVERFGYDPERWRYVTFSGQLRTQEPPPLPTAKPSIQPQAREALSSARARPGGRRSPLFRWMVRNFDQMQAELADGSPNWAGIAAILGDAGITDRDGNRPTTGTVEQTWRRLRKAVADGRVKPRQTHPPAAGIERPIQPMEPALPPDSSAPDDEFETARVSKFRPARPR